MPVQFSALCTTLPYRDSQRALDRCGVAATFEVKLTGMTATYSCDTHLADTVRRMAPFRKGPAKLWVVPLN